MNGRAVHARAGERERYQPLASYLAPGHPGDALAFVRAFHDRFGYGELYLADLDAIMGRPPQRSLRRAIAAERPGVRIWVDAGVAAPGQAREHITDGAARVIVGLETLPALPDPRATLERIVAGVGDAAALASDPSGAASRVVFSLDLRAGQPITANPALAGLTPVAIAELAAEAGITTVILLDLARVGSGAGVDLALVRAIRGALPGVELVAGGGVRDARDVERLADAGADGALVGSALHDETAAQGLRFSTRGTLSSESSLPDG